MVKNREPVDSQSESGDEEESGEELEEASSDELNSQGSDSDEPEQTQVLKKVSTPPTQKQIKVSNKATPVTMQTQSSSSSEEEESGSESESDSEQPEQKSVTVSGPKKPRSGVQATTSTVAKRPAEEKQSEVREAKKAKKKEDSPVKPSNDDPKKSLFQRLWSEGDEIAILNGMIEYSNKKKLDPVADLNAFHDFIKENLHVDVSRTQLQDKIRRLKKKYTNNKKKEKDGKCRTLGKAHEQKTYELSKLVWGAAGGNGVVGSPKANGSGVKKAPSKKEAKDSNNGVVVRENVDERIMRAGEELFVGEGIEGKEEWKKLKVQEIELHVKQVEVKLAQSRLVLGALKSRDC